MTQHNSQYYTRVLVKVYLQLLRGDIPQGLTKYSGRISEVGVEKVKEKRSIGVWSQGDTLEKDLVIAPFADLFWCDNFLCNISILCGYIVLTADY